MPASGRPSIYLVGTAGNPHYGDEVITTGWLRWYERNLPDADIWLDCPRPGQAAVLHADSHPRLRCTDTLFHAAWNAPSEDPEECVAFGATVLDDPGRIAREASGLSLLRSCDAIHVLGGGYINAQWPRHLTLLGAVGHLAAQGVTPAAMTGAGLTPITSATPAALASALEHFLVVDTRDPASAELLGPLHPSTSMSGDDALLDLLGQRIDVSRTPSAVVEVQSDLISSSLDELADHVVALLRHWQLDQERVLLLESLPPNDVAVLDLLAPRLPQIELLPFELLWRDGFPALDSVPWITTRLHTHLMAAATGAWGVALGASNEITASHEALLGLGSDWVVQSAPFDVVDRRPPVREPFGGTLSSLVEAKNSVAASVLDMIQR